MAAPHRLGEAEIASRRTAWSDEWRAAALCTEPADRPRAEVAIRGLYAASGRPAPEIRWVPSPRAGMLAWSYLTTVCGRIINPHARGDVGTGSNREFNGLADPFGMEPAWVARLVGRVEELSMPGTTRLGVDPLARVSRVLGLSAATRPLTLLRSALPNATLALTSGGRPDPAAVDTAGGVLGDAWPVLVGSLREDLARSVFSDALMSVVRQLLSPRLARRDVIQAMQPGQWDPVTPVLAATRDVFGATLWRHRDERDERGAAIDLRLELARSAGPWWALETVAVVSERPLVMRTDDQGRPHALGGPAIAWGDGFEIHAVHGVVMDLDVVMDPGSITVTAINRETNVERRRVLVELFGAERLVREGGAVLVHQDDTGRLWRRVLDADGPSWRRRDEPVVLVEVTNSTPEPDGSHRTYFLRVPPATQTAREGVAWTFGLGAVEYRPSRES